MAKDAGLDHPVTTSRREIEEVVHDVECFTRHAEQLIQSYTPIGFGTPYEVAQAECLADLKAARVRFRSAIRKAQREHRWATK